MEAMQVIKKNPKPIAIAAGVAGAAAVTIAGLYLLYKRISNRTPKTTTNNPSNIEDLTERELESIIKGIKVTYDGQTLSLDTVVEATVAITKFITVTSQKLQDENSKLRSANKNNLKLYAQLCKDSEISRELAAGQASKEVLRRLSIPESVWQRSLQCHYQQVGQKLNGIPIVALKPARLLSLDEIRKVILRLTELTRAEISNIDTWTSEIEDPAMIALAMSVRPSDIVEEEMGIGEREINQALEKYMPQFGVEDQKIVQEYIKEIQTLPSKVMQKTGKTFSSY